MEEKTAAFIKKIQTRYGNELAEEYSILSEYSKSNEKLRMRHNVCGHEFEMTPNDFLNGHRCPACANKKRAKKSKYNIDSYKDEVRKRYGDEYEILSTELTSLADKIKIKHTTCGTIYEATARNLLRGMGCRKCSYQKTGAKQRGISKPKKLKKTKEEVISDIKNAIGDDYELVSDYLGSTHYITLKHKVCGNTYDVKTCNIITHHTTCPFCAKGSTSKEEKEVLDYIKSIYSGPIEENKRLEKDGIVKEADILLPEKKLAIEYDGLYWHSDEKVEDTYHIDKTLFFRSLGYRTIHIFEDEWTSKKEIVKRKLASILGLTAEKKVYARKAAVKPVSSKDKDDFLEKNHIQGKDSASIRYGLYDQDELVAVMTFTKKRKALGAKRDSEEYELSRYATSCHVVGGFSKLLKYILREHPEIKNIITYADLRWSDFDSTVYTANGFTLDHVSKPNYWYLSKGSSKREFRYNYRKSALKSLFPEAYDATLSEKEIMKKAGYHIIYDCGNLVYKMTIK